MKFDRIIGIGDIHGCYHTLLALIDQIQPTQDDLIVFTGDYVDRGRYTYEVISYLIDFKERFPNTQFVIGNHEDLFMRHLDGDYDHRRCFFYNGGHATVNSYNEHIGVRPYKWDDVPEDHREFLKSLVAMVQVEDFVFVHGGVRPGFALADQLDHDLIWIRDEFLYSPYDWGKTIVHGHTPMEEAEMEDYHRRYKNKINLDSGCVYGYTLTAVNVLTREEWEQPIITKDIKIGVD